MKSGDLLCPACSAKSTLIPILIYGGSVRGDEWDGWECIECFASWDKDGKAC